VTKLHVAGIGYRPLDKKAGEAVCKSDVVLANGRLLDVFKGYAEYETVKDRIKVLSDIHETMDFLREHINSNPRNPNSGYQNITLLASGDPMFFGIGRLVLEEFDKDVVEIYPDLSSVQIAFSRIKETWTDALFVSFHGGPDPAKRRKLEYEIGDIPSLISRHSKLAVLTDRVNNPAVIAKVIARSEIPRLSLRGSQGEPKQSQERPGTGSAILVDEIASLPARNDSIHIYVCEKLGYPDEKITEGTPEEIANLSFDHPNVVVIARKGLQVSGPGFGLKETDIRHSKGMITKDEARAVTIHKLRLPQKGVLWDIGAGSGAVSLEAARLCPELKVFAIERNDEQAGNIAANKDGFGAVNVKVTKGEAPEALKDLPVPDRVFIGGSGGRLGGIVSYTASLMSVGIIVVNAATLETLNDAVRALEENGFSADVCEVSVSRSKMVGGKRHMHALNPVFIITGEKA